MRYSLAACFLTVCTLSTPLPAQITADEYANRRETLASQLPDGIFIARGAVSPVQDYLSFHQVPGFLYLTGYREADAALLLDKQGGRSNWTLFVQARTRRRRSGRGGATALTPPLARPASPHFPCPGSALPSTRS
jgi:hypothetical protein